MADRAGTPAGLDDFRLPVNGRLIEIRPLTGAEDVLLLEANGEGARLALALTDRLTSAADEGAQINWQEMTVADLNALICRLRQMVIGDRVQADVVCQTSGCGERIDISFGMSAYLAHHAPAQPGDRSCGNVEPDAEPGWFRLHPARQDSRTAEPVRFRLPQVADELALAGLPGADMALAARCIRPEKILPRVRRRVESVMEKMAPDLCSDLEGDCPVCHEKMRIHFDPRRFCLRELRDRAKFIYQDVDLLARRYHWSEAEILAMPHGRRVNYAELARLEE